MAKGRKYDYRAIQNEDASAWTAEITRRVTSKKTIVSKSQAGFTTESEALAWAQEAIKPFVRNLVDQNILRTEVQQEKAEKARVYRNNKRRSVLSKKD